jgi:hypothetical protein
VPASAPAPTPTPAPTLIITTNYIFMNSCCFQTFHRMCVAYDSSPLGTSKSEVPKCDDCERISTAGARLASCISSSCLVSCQVCRCTTTNAQTTSQ